MKLGNQKRTKNANIKLCAGKFTGLFPIIQMF